MKIILILSVLICFGANAQLNVSFNGFPDDASQNVLFRGFDNVIEISAIGEEFEYTIETENVFSTMVSLSDDPNVKRYIIKAGREKTATFKFHKKGETAIFQTVTCQVANMPDPFIHIDGIPSEGKISQTATSIDVKLLAKFRFKSSFKIMKFTMFMADQVLISKNGEFTDEMKEMLEGSISGDVVSINASVLGVDDITRLIGGGFVVE